MMSYLILPLDACGIIWMIKKSYLIYNHMWSFIDFLSFGFLENIQEACWN